MISNRSNVGRQFGNYLVEAEIGKGGFARVYKGRHLTLDERAVAIKVFQGTSFDSQEERERFLQEAHILEKLKHPHILHIHDVSQLDGVPYLVVDYASKGSLRDLLSKRAPQRLPLAEALNIMQQVGEALHYAHQQSIIHRDLKPENILFNAQNQVLLADFGIAKALVGRPVSYTSHPLGTLGYMAPEAISDGAVSKQSDLYALGMVAYELFTGHKPTTNCFVPLDFPPDVPENIQRAILKAVAKDLYDRYADVPTFIAALTTIYGQTTELDMEPWQQRNPAGNDQFSQQNPEQWGELINALYRKGHYETALKACIRATHFYPTNADIFYLKGKVLERLGHFTEAFAAYDEAIHLKPRFARAYVGEGELYEHFNEYEEALKAYREANRVAPESPYGYDHKGNVLAALERYEEALDAYDAAIRCATSFNAEPFPDALFLDEQFLSAYYHKGELLELLKRYDEVFAAYDDAIAVATGFTTEPYYRKGYLLERLKRFEDALVLWEQVLSIVAEPDAYYHKGQMLVALEYKTIKRHKGQKAGVVAALKARMAPKFRYKEALAAYDQAIQLQPDCALYYKARADVLCGLGEIKQANQVYKQAFQIQEKTGQVFFQGDRHIQIDKQYEWLFPLLALNPLGVPIIVGVFLQSWWLFVGGLLVEWALITLCSFIRRGITRPSSIVSISLAALPIGIGWLFAFALIYQLLWPEMMVPLALAGFLLGFFGNAFLFYVIDEWTIWGISNWSFWKIVG